MQAELFFAVETTKISGGLMIEQAGYIGGDMTKRLIEQAERAMSGQQ